jgi:methylthioribose-1-phosphate isomerase
MNIRTIEWVNNAVKIIDQTKLPARFKYLYLKDVKSLTRAIKELKVRGAPALGAAAGLGVYLGIKDSKADHFKQFKRELDAVIKYIGSSRPTARNLFWGLERVRQAALKNKRINIRQIKNIILKEARRIIEEDRRASRSIGYFGSRPIKDKDNILTICNAGILATIDYGTALGVIYRAKQDGKRLKVFALETRPLLQGARLTAWELQKKGVDVTLISDSMAAALMQEGRIDKVIAGADRIALNGDAANKIGTYNLAILSKYHKIPFYIAAPKSTFDFKIRTGRQIRIEERMSKEVTSFMGRLVAPCGVKVFNPAFDVTPNNLISAIITDKGIIKPPYLKNIRDTLAAKAKGVPRQGHPYD